MVCEVTVALEFFWLLPRDWGAVCCGNESLLDETLLAPSGSMLLFDSSVA